MLRPWALKRKLPPRQRLELFIKVCQAIQHAHQKGIIHLDIKASNVLVTIHDDSPVPKIIDFGVAKARGAMSQTRTGAVKGTYAYMSPEQLRCENVDRRSDIFSLGVVLWEAVTGRRLFKRETDFRIFKAFSDGAV